MEKHEHSQAAELLRIALPLMSKHGIAVTPRNYAVWYEYVSGGNELLQKTLDELIASCDQLTCEQLELVYRDCIATPETKLADHAREVLRQLLVGASDSFSDASTEFTHFDDVLVEISKRLVDTTSVETVQNAVSELSAETKHVQEHSAKVVAQLADSQREVEELRLELEDAKKQATTDALTGLSNRGVFDQCTQELMAENGEGDPEFGLLMVDIDKFKNINDSHGHLVGDKVIRFVAKTITESVKGKDVAARYGGEEFAVLLPNTTLIGCRAVAESIRVAVAKARLVKSGTRESLGVTTISGGIGIYRKGDDPADLIGRADAALYFSKQNRRNRVSDENAVAGAAPLASTSYGTAAN